MKAIKTELKQKSCRLMSKTQYIKTFVALFVLLQLLLLFSAFQQWPFQALFSPKLQAIVDTLHLGKTE